MSPSGQSAERHCILDADDQHLMVIWTCSSSERAVPVGISKSTGIGPNLAGSK
jgi:hypothetical protein